MSWALPLGGDESEKDMGKRDRMEKERKYCKTVGGWPSIHVWSGRKLMTLG